MPASHHSPKRTLRRGEGEGGKGTRKAGRGVGLQFLFPVASPTLTPETERAGIRSGAIAQWFWQLLFMANHRLNTGHRLQGSCLTTPRPVTAVWHLCLEGCHLPRLHTGVVVQGSLGSVPNYLWGMGHN